ncbi:DUF3396 domain-containing protein [Mitsuaria sp. CC2]|uniref:type VI immunity family protein n=1 Tax=Mitsuaria sp. CC2 TaxID=3029186 RepID=UPI003B8DB6EF
MPPVRMTLTAAAFCVGPLEDFVAWAERASSAWLTSPLWRSLPGAAMIGAGAGRYRSAEAGQFLAHIAAWRRSHTGRARRLFSAEYCAGTDPMAAEQSVEFVADADAAVAGSPVRHWWQAELSIDALRAQPRWPDHLEALMGVLLAGPLESGYLAPALASPRDPDDEPSAGTGGWGLRVPPLDVSTNGATRLEIGGRCRGARWMVLLDDALVERAGGEEELVGLRAAGVVAASARGRWRLQVPGSPFAGWVHDGPTAAQYGAMARFLEPMTLFDDLALQRARFADNADLLDRYERRFLHELH